MATTFRLLVLITGDYGRRHADNLQAHTPAGWQIETWQTPCVLPPVLDYAEKLAGTPVAEAIEQVGLHHHYPCRASMGVDTLYKDTLMYVSGNLMKSALKEALGEHLDVPTIRPPGYVDP